MNNNSKFLDLKEEYKLFEEEIYQGLAIPKELLEGQNFYSSAQTLQEIQNNIINLQNRLNKALQNKNNVLQ
jgi:hypothetical protein